MSAHVYLVWSPGRQPSFLRHTSIREHCSFNIKFSSKLIPSSSVLDFVFTIFRVSNFLLQDSCVPCRQVRRSHKIGSRKLSNLQYSFLNYNTPYSRTHLLFSVQFYVRVVGVLTLKSRTKGSFINEIILYLFSESIIFNYV